MAMRIYRSLFVTRHIFIPSLAPNNSVFTRCHSNQTSKSIEEVIEYPIDTGQDIPFYGPSEQGQKVIKVAILGTPNAGKSTLINNIVGKPIFCVSKKVHTTRHKAKAAIFRGNVQVLFVDTPGLVSASEVKRHHLEKSFEEVGLRSTEEADIVGIMHDVGNKWTREYLDRKILHVLRNMNPSKKSFLILNKIDMVKPKSQLLEITASLTGTQKILPGEEGAKSNKNVWPHFSEVFLVSALNGSGLKDIVDYLVGEAEDGSWLLPPGKITDQKTHITLAELVRGRLYDALPQEVPYGLTVETELMHKNELGEIIGVVLVTCPIARHKKILVAGGGRVIRDVALAAEADARTTFKCHVRLRVVVVSEPAKEKNYKTRR